MSTAEDSRVSVLSSAREARDWCAARRRTFEQRLAVLVGIDTGFDEPGGRDRAAALLAEWAAVAGCDCELVTTAAGDTLVARLAGEG
ncbi:MAG: hypothetical protein FJ000_00855, partial [Actinobacteria bacterium]|nr:hypothetical protein [Actinomycetota bacterium]